MNFRQTPFIRTARATLLAVLICAGVVMSGARLEEPLRAAPATRRISAPGTLPLTFERVKAGVYTARSRGYDVKISRGDVVIALAAGEALPSARVRLLFGGAAPGVLVPEARVQPTKAYPARNAPWRADLRTFGRVRMNAIYPGIDVVFYGSDRQLEYEVFVAPGGSPEQIAMVFEGADSVSRDASGDLVVSASGRQLTLRRPDAYQEVNGTRTSIATEYIVRDQVTRVVLGQYDRTRPLVIHPAP